MISTKNARSGAGLTNRRRGGRPRAALAIAVGAASVLLAMTACTSSATPVAAPTVADTYGGLPSFLPTSAVQPDSMLTGTADNPALTSQGDTVEVHLPSASVQVTVIGPEVPGEGLPYQADATTCTWTVTMTGASAPVAISAHNFNSIDHLGKVYEESYVPGQPVPPATIKPGQTITFELRAVMTVGEGLMRWAPDGKSIVASWDFTVEND